MTCTFDPNADDYCILRFQVENRWRLMRKAVGLVHDCLAGETNSLDLDQSTVWLRQIVALLVVRFVA